MTKTTLGTMTAATLLTLLGAAARAHAGETPAPVQAVYETVEANARTVMSWVYPSVAFEEMTACRWGETDAGYVLSCRFDYVDDGDHDARRLAFRLNPRGMITAIEDQGGSSVFPAFFTLGMTRGLLAEVAKDELAHRAPGNDAGETALLNLLARSPQPRVVLAFLLNLETALR